MSSDLDQEHHLRLHETVQYLLEEHGEHALREAKAALEYARQINDRDTVDVFTEVLEHLGKLHRE